MFIVFAALWLAFSLAVVVDSERIEETWKAFRDLPIVGQALLATLFLPVVAGFWIWETSWPFVLRLALVASLAWWNILVFWPFRKQSDVPDDPAVQ